MIAMRSLFSRYLKPRSRRRKGRELVFPQEDIRVVCRELTSAVLLCLMLSMLLAVTCLGQTSSARIYGHVVDEHGDLIVGAVVTVAGVGRTERQTVTDHEGSYVIAGLPAGQYTIRVVAKGFEDYQNVALQLTGGSQQNDITLFVKIENQKVDVPATSPVSVNPDNNANGIVLRGDDLNALPDDPDALASFLQELAGPSAGPNGGHFVVDGFTGGRLPSKQSIREIRINQNPFTAEYDRLGLGRIEIITKPGTDKFVGQASLALSDQVLNSRNPFSIERAPYQLRRYGGVFAGPLNHKKAAFFLDFERRDEDDSALINATIVSPAFVITPVRENVITPRRTTTFSPRFDWQLNPNNTLIARYTYARSSFDNSGIGNFSLFSHGLDLSNTEQTLQFSETAVINKGIVNEIRFQYFRGRNHQDGHSATAATEVLEAFTEGGFQLGQSARSEDRFEFLNFTSWSAGPHTLKAGARVRQVQIDDLLRANFAGTFTFAGGLGPELDSQNHIVVDGNGQPILIPVSSIERYRRTLLGASLGLSPAAVRTLGGGATQFSISSGNPDAKVSQFDVGAFLQDDWRVREGLMLGVGLRYETQNHIHSPFDFAPRFAFAWSPGAAGNRQAKTVIRGGIGVFYDRFGEELTLEALRFDGIHQQRFFSSEQAILDSYPVVPTIQVIAATATDPTLRRVATGLRTPYTTQSTVSIERQLPHAFVLSATFVNSLGRRQLRSRDVNAPAAPTGARPVPSLGEVYQYEATGRWTQNQMLIGLTGRLNPKFTFLARYILSSIKSDTDGPNTFPANQYDLSGEYGRSTFDTRHRFFAAGNIRLPFEISLSPYLIASSGRPFNITTGLDTNGDTIFNDRPALGSGSASGGVVLTRFGTFVLNPLPGQSTIPRNFGAGPALVRADLRASRTFRFGNAGQAKATPATPKAAGQTNAQATTPAARPAAADKPFGLTVSLQATNIFNRANLATPIGNLSSPVFGQSISLDPGARLVGFSNSAAGNRRLEVQLRFSF